MVTNGLVKGSFHLVAALLVLGWAVCPGAAAAPPAGQRDVYPGGGAGARGGEKTVTGTERVMVLLVEFAGTDTFDFIPEGAVGEGEAGVLSSSTWDALGVADAAGNSGSYCDCSLIMTAAQRFTPSGPLHNQIPRPLSAADPSGTMVWTEDFSANWYQQMLFGGGVAFNYLRQDATAVQADFTGKSVRQYFLDMSNSQYTVNGDVIGWLQLPHSMAWYGADCCPGGRSGGSADSSPIAGAGSPASFVRDALDALIAIQNTIPGFSFSNYDLNADGVIDRLFIIHAGYGEEESSTVLLNRTDYGESALWSRAGGLSTPYLVDGVNNISAAPYVILPENVGAAAVSRHLAGYLGGDSLADPTGQAAVSPGIWTPMADPVTGFPAGFQPAALDPWNLDKFGWLNPTVLSDPTQTAEITLDQAGTASANPRCAKIALADGALPLAVAPQGTHGWWGGKEDEANAQMTLNTPIPLPATPAATLSVDLSYAIEPEWDFLWVQVSTDAGATWATLTNAHTVCTHDPGWIGTLNGFPDDLCAAGIGGFTGYSSAFPDYGTETFDLAPYAGQSILVRFWHMTDWGTTYEGVFLDNVRVEADATVLFSDDGESGGGAWTYAAPWMYSDGTQTFTHNYYLQWRNTGATGGFDSVLGNPAGPHGGADPGLLVWYNNNYYEDNYIFDHLRDYPGFGPKGRMLLVDAHPEPLRDPYWEAYGYLNEGANLSGNCQMRDAAFSLNDTADFTLSPPLVYGTAPVDFPGRPAVSMFLDEYGFYPGSEFVNRGPGYAGGSYKWVTKDWDAGVVLPSTQFHGLNAPGYTANEEFRWAAQRTDTGRLACYWLGANVGLGYDGGTGNPKDAPGGPGQYGWKVYIVSQTDTTVTLAIWNSQHNEPNYGPRLDTIAPRSVREGQKLEVVLRALDPNDDPLAFSGMGLPDGAALDPATGSFTWRPGPGTAGQHFTVTFSAADDGDPALSDTKTLDVDVLDRILVAVPDVTGQTAAAAEGLLDAVDLVISTTTEQCSGTVPAGLVISQFPEAGAQLYTGNAVALVVSRGPCVAVPDVVGLAQADAEAALTAAGLVLGAVTEQWDASAPAGQVIAQTPAAGADAAPGGAVDLVVSKGVEPVTVPDVVGMTEAEAGAAVGAAGLAPGAVTEAYDPAMPAGQVVSQDPAAGTLAAPGTAVDVVVSKGVAPVAVPDVAGMTQSAAEAAVTGAGLTAGAVAEVFSATVPAGQVVSQSPAAGALAAPGTAVDLTVSKGPQPVSVPDVAGMTQAAAGAAVGAAGLVLGAVTESYSDTVPAGRVISQNPAAGGSVPPGSLVDIEVSKGAAPPGDVAVPDLSGMTELQAEAALAAAGLVPGLAAEQYSATVPVGQVAGQSPAAGAMVAPGTAVNLIVSKGPEPVAVPDVAGMTQAAAEAALTGAGLAVGAVTEAFSATVPAGRVISQNPAAGVSVLPGAAVDLAVSKGVQPATVPDVAGLTQAAAGTAIGAAGLTLGLVTEVYSATVPAGRVVSQTPAAGASAAPGSAVDVAVSRGPEPVAVPNVAGLAQAAAETALTGAGFTVGAVTEAFSATVPAGQVISQNPAAGASAAPGTAVALVVSKGAQPGVVPDVAGMTQTAAAAAVGAAGLSVGTVTQAYSATVSAGRVVSQSPAAGTQAAAGSPVDLVVSQGVQPVTVPDVAGMSQAAAGLAIGSAGLTLGLVTEVYSATAPAGQVISQNPEAGASAAPGASVALVVSKGAQPGTVPSVAGMTQAAAGAAVGAAGLALGAVTEAFSEAVAAGRVISQNPAAGTEVAAGSAVDLSVSKGADPAAAAAARAALAEAFSQADADGDGVLTLAEAQAALPSLSQAVFDLLDANGDGALDADELGVEGGCGCACSKAGLTAGGLKARLGDLFLGGMALALLAALGRGRGV